MSYQLPITRNARYLFGIDPDLKKNGLALWDKSLNELTDNRILTFSSLIRHILKFDRNDTLIYLEAGWLNKVKNFHAVHLPERLRKASKDAQIRYTAAVRERIAHDVGQNAAAGKLLFEMLTNLGYAVILIQPTERKWKPEDYTRFTGKKTKDQEKIDAARLVVGL